MSKVLIYMTAMVAVIVTVVAYYGWALSLCWNWTMPVIFNLPKLTITQAIALSATIGMLRGNKSTDKDKDDLMVTLILAFALPLIAISVVWICMN